MEIKIVSYHTLLLWKISNFYFKLSVLQSNNSDSTFDAAVFLKTDNNY